MRYTINEILDYEKNLSDLSDENESAFDAWQNFRKDGSDTFNNIPDILTDYFRNEKNRSLPPKLDILFAFITAGALELEPRIDGNLEKEMPDCHKVISEVFYDDELLNKTMDKYKVDSNTWENIWINSWGEASSLYFFLISKCKSINGIWLNLMDYLLDYTEEDKILSYDTFPFSDTNPDMYKNIFSSNISDIDACIAHIWMMFCGYKEMINQISDNTIFKNDPSSAFHSNQYDKIIGNIPYGSFIKDLDDGPRTYYSSLISQYPSLAKANTSDWIYAYKLSSILSENGRATIIVSNGSLANKLDSEFRKLLIEQEKIEAVISLPAEKKVYKHFLDWSSPFHYKTLKKPASIVILSNNNKSVKTIDLQRMLESNTEKYNIKNTSYNGEAIINTDLLFNDLKNIIENSDEDTSFCKVLITDELIETNYALNFKRYSSMYDLGTSGISFGQVIKSVRRGSGLKNDEIAKLITPEPTDYYYFTGSNTAAVINTFGLSNIHEPEQKLKKYCFKNMNLAISKNGSPKKIGVVEIKDNEMILASDNCFIVELDTDKINPYYIAAYLNSEKGQKAIDGFTSGTSVNSLTVVGIKELMIPYIPLDEQKEIAGKYEAILKELQIIKMREYELENKLSDIFFEED